MLTQTDINDYNSDEYYQPEGSVPMKLYELPMLAFFKIIGEDSIYKFSKIDGAYSICTGVSEDVRHQGIWHFAAWTPVIKLLKKQDENKRN